MDEEKIRAIVSAIIQIAKSSRLDVVAEGVESVEQSDMLGKLGCNIIQGFLYSRPKPID